MFETVESGRKSDRTRARISAAAIDSFIERGYADTTMRLIAERAGVSVGNAYYYFPSKNHLVQELYERVQHQHADLARPRLQDASTLIDRLRVVFCASLETLEPYRRSAPGFLTAMVTPDSPSIRSPQSRRQPETSRCRCSARPSGVLRTACPQTSLISCRRRCSSPIWH